MKLHAGKIALIILGVTALICSRAMFAFFNDPEGPNLLVVVVAAAIFYIPSLAVYSLYKPKEENVPKNLSLAIFTQILLATGIYFCFFK